MQLQSHHQTEKSSMMPSQPFILVLASSTSLLCLADGSTIETGVWAEELLIPMHQLKDSGWPLVLATPDGTVPRIDPQSLLPENLGSGNNGRLQKIQEHLTGLELAPVLPLGKIMATLLPALRGVFLPGGNGPLADFPEDPRIGRLLSYCREYSIPVAALCHGTAALLSPDPMTGDRAFHGFEVTCFTEQEESLTSLRGLWPYTLEARLREAGFLVCTAPPWQPCCTVSGGLVCGQNPASSAAMAEAFLQQLEKKRKNKGTRHGY